MLVRTLGKAAAIGFFVTLCACSRAQESRETAEEHAPPGEAAVAEQGAMAEEGQPAEQQSEPATPAEAAETALEQETMTEAKPPPAGGVSPAPGVEPSKVKNWMLIEFARKLEDADLAWLEENGFRVDTVMSPMMVRGWLEKPEGGEVISQDPRVARIHAQMR